MSGLPRFLNSHEKLQLEDLLQERPIQEIVELAAGGQGADFDVRMPIADCSC